MTWDEFIRTPGAQVGALIILGIFFVIFAKRFFDEYRR
jgi:hypothetical protein